MPQAHSAKSAHPCWAGNRCAVARHRVSPSAASRSPRGATDRLDAVVRNAQARQGVDDEACAQIIRVASKDANAGFPFALDRLAIRSDGCSQRLRTVCGCACLSEKLDAAHVFDNVSGRDRVRTLIASSCEDRRCGQGSRSRPTLEGCQTPLFHNGTQTWHDLGGSGVDHKVIDDHWII